MAAAFNAMIADDRPINVRPWLYRIARNRSLNHLRRIRAIGVDSMDIHLSEQGLSTADKVHGREEFRLLVGDIHELPETQKTALVLREMDALSYEQIAEAMETTVPSVKSLLVRARVSLAEAAEARLLSCEEVRIELGEVAEGLRRRTSPLVRRHLKACKRCSAFRTQLKQTNKALTAIMPIGPMVILKKLVITHVGHSAGSGATARPAPAPPARPPRRAEACSPDRRRLRLRRHGRDRHQGRGRARRRRPGHRRRGRGRLEPDAPGQAPDSGARPRRPCTRRCSMSRRTWAAPVHVLDRPLKNAAGRWSSTPTRPRRPLIPAVATKTHDDGEPDDHQADLSHTAAGARGSAARADADADRPDGARRHPTAARSLGRHSGAHDPSPRPLRCCRRRAPRRRPPHQARPRRLPGQPGRAGLRRRHSRRVRHPGLVQHAVAPHPRHAM